MAKKEEKTEEKALATEAKKEEKVPTAEAKKEKKKPATAEANKETVAVVDAKKDEKALAASGNMISTVSKQRGIQGGLSLNIEIQNFIDFKEAFSIRVREPPKGTYKARKYPSKGKLACSRTFLVVTGRPLSTSHSEEPGTSSIHQCLAMHFHQKLKTSQ